MVEQTKNYMKVKLTITSITFDLLFPSTFAILFVDWVVGSKEVSITILDFFVPVSTSDLIRS